MTIFNIQKKTFFSLAAALTALLAMGCGTLSGKPAQPAAETFYPSLPQRPRLQFLLSISGENDLGGKQSALRRFLFGARQGRPLGKPYDIAVCRKKIYVMDRMYKALVILDLNDRTMSFLDDHGPGRLEDPAGIWVSSKDIKYIADMQRKQVVAFDADNHFLRTYGDRGVFEKPVDVAVFMNRIYVVDMQKAQLFILELDSGRLIKAVGQKDAFFKPSHVTVGPGGIVFVTDAFHYLIKKFSLDGAYLGSVGYHGDQIGGFVRPKGTAVDKAGRLYAVDAAFENVQIFDDQDRMLLYFGGPGEGPGDLGLPSGITVDDGNIAYFQQFANPHFKLEYLVYVTSMFGPNPLNVYGFGHWTPGE